MIQLNDAKAPTTLYERELFHSKMPRAYWQHLVDKISFLDYQIYRNYVEYQEVAPEAKKKAGKAVNTPASRLLFTAKGSQQAENWEKLRGLVYSWDPKGPAIYSERETKVSPEKHFSLFCCENLRVAQLAMYTMMHYMVASTFKQSERPYRVETVRSFELLDMMQKEDTQKVPHVVMIPSLIQDLPATQISMVSELMSSSYRTFAATTMHPQAFFERFGIAPYPCFYINEIEVCSVQKLLDLVAGVK